MRHIEKGEPPPELTKYQETPDVAYAGAPREVKDAIRRDGYRDQCGVCCYCCGPLPWETSLRQIEHFEAQSRAPDRTLDWGNLLVSCASGRPEVEPSRRGELTCDDHKGSDPIAISPLDIHCEAHFLYDPATGRILDRDADADAARAIRVLNLDCLRLRQGRLAAMAEAAEFAALLSEAEWVRRFAMPVNGVLTPYETALRSRLRELYPA